MTTDTMDRRYGGVENATQGMADSKLHMKPPSRLLQLLELRAGWEFGAMLAAWPLLKQTPRGDGHPVFVMPGLIASDISTQPLRAFLADRGYKTYGWELGRNYGFRGNLEASIVERLKKIQQENGGRKVSIIGWSLGGLYARLLGMRHPDSVRSVITLGSPFTGHPRATNAWRIYEFTSGHSVETAKTHHSVEGTPPVPTTSIFSRTDGVVAWQCSVQEEGPEAENIEVESSHIGLGVNPAVLFAVADRLAQPEGEWAPFDRSGLRSLFFKNPRR